MPRPTRTRPDLPTYLTTRRRRRRVIAVAGVIVLALLVLADRAGLLLHQSDDLARYDGRTFRVVSVVDGDTLHIDAPDGRHATTRVRLWGIDTPEMNATTDAPPDPFAEQATAFARRHAAGQAVTLMLEPHRQRGNYGRLLAYVYLADGRSLNEMLLEVGLATAEPRWHHRYRDHYAHLERTARDAGRGLWQTAPPAETTPP